MGVYNNFATDVMRGKIDLISGRFRVMLLSETFRPKFDQQARRADIHHEVLLVQGYSNGGAPVQLTVGPRNDQGLRSLTFSEVVWPFATIAARFACFYHDHGNAMDDELVAVCGFGHTIKSTRSEFRLTAAEFHCAL